MRAGSQTRRVGPSLKEVLLSSEVWLAALVVVLCQIPLPDSTRFMTALYNSAHAPLFGAVALAALSALRRYAPSARALRLYGLAAGIALALGLAVEALQAFGTRNPAFSDLLRDALGIAGFLVTRAAFDERLIGHRSIWARRLALCAVGAALIVAGTVPVLRAAVLYATRDAALPHLVDFASPSATQFLKTKDAVLHVRCSPQEADRPDCHGDLVLLPTDYPSLIIEEPYPDWRGYSELELVVYGAAPPFDLTLRIDDLAHNGDYGDRFNTVLKVEEGRNEFSVPLSAVQAAPESRKLDLAHVHSIVLFAAQPDDVRRMSIDTIRLQ